MGDTSSSPFGGFFGSLIGGVASAWGQDRQNKENRAEAQRNRQFQERMSNTSMQRAAKDYEAAGLNRILAMPKGASTPGGNMAVAGNVPGAGISSALQIQQIKNMKAQERLTGVQADALALPGDISTSAKGIFGRVKQFFEKAVGDVQVNRINSARIQAVPRAKTFPMGTEPNSAKGVPKYERNAIGYQARTHNEAGMRAVEAYVQKYPKSTEKEWRSIYDAAVRKSKGK